MTPPSTRPRPPPMPKIAEISPIDPGTFSAGNSSRMIEMASGMMPPPMPWSTRPATTTSRVSRARTRRCPRRRRAGRRRTGGACRACRRAGRRSASPPRRPGDSPSAPTRRRSCPCRAPSRSSPRVGISVVWATAKPSAPMARTARLRSGCGRSGWGGMELPETETDLRVRIVAETGHLSPLPGSNPTIGGSAAPRLPAVGARGSASVARPMSARERYASVLRAPHVLPLVLASMLARVPMGIEGLAVVLYLSQARGSFAVAGPGERRARPRGGRRRAGAEPAHRPRGTARGAPPGRPRPRRRGRRAHRR